MINFASLFNQFRGSSNNTINDLLQQNDVTLHKLLDEDQFINEFKAGNSKLLEFMKYNKLKQLVDLITIVGPADDKKHGYKFPSTAVEVLSCDLNFIQEFFFPQGKLYDQIITYQDQVVETEVDVQEIPQKENSKTEENTQTQPEKQKTIIKDSLQTTEQQTQSISKQAQNPPEPQINLPEPTQQKTLQSQIQQQQCQPIQKPKIKVQKIQKVQMIQKFQVQPLIHHLFNYFDQQINYILTGYVCKVLTSLFNKKGNQMMDFLFTQGRVERMVNHIESRSVGEFLLKVLTFQSGKFAQQRAQFFTKLLLKLSQNNTIHVLSNFSSFVSQTIEKAATNSKSNSPVPQFTTIFFTPQVVTIVIQNVMSEDENVSVYNAPILLTYLTNVPFTLPQDESIVKQFKSLLEMFISTSLQKLSVTNTDRPKLGVGRIKIIEILNYILKENLLGSRQKFASQSNTFNIFFNLCKNYEMNNVLHNEVVKLVSLAFQDESLSQSLLRDDVLLKFIFSEAEEDQQICQGIGSQKFRKGFIGHVVQISRLVQQYAQKGNEVALRIIDRDEFDKVLSKLVQKQISQGRKNLGGFSLKRDIKTDIMFQKQEIITHFIDFLTNSPKPVFETEPEPINIQHPDFLEQMQRQIEENLSIQQDSKNITTSQAVQKAEEGTQTAIQPQIRVEIHFFKGHLDYDLDELMDGL